MAYWKCLCPGGKRRETKAGLASSPSQALTVNAFQPSESLVRLKVHSIPHPGSGSGSGPVPVPRYHLFFSFPLRDNVINIRSICHGQVIFLSSPSGTASTSVPTAIAATPGVGVFAVFHLPDHRQTLSGIASFRRLAQDELQMRGMARCNAGHAVSSAGITARHAGHSWGAATLSLARNGVRKMDSFSLFETIYNVIICDMQANYLRPCMRSN